MITLSTGSVDVTFRIEGGDLAFQVHTDVGYAGQGQVSIADFLRLVGDDAEHHQECEWMDPAEWRRTNFLDEQMEAAAREYERRNEEQRRARAQALQEMREKGWVIRE